MSTAVDVNQVEDQLLETYDQLAEKTTSAGETLKQFIAQRREIREAEGQMQEQLAQLAGGGVTMPSAPVQPANGRRRSTSASASTKKVAKKKSKTGPAAKKTERKRGGYQNEKSLAAVIMEVLDRKGNENGLQIADIRDAIENEKLWLTDKDLGKQVQTNLQSLKDRGKIVRDAKEKVYYIPGED